ncbi:unnamed protein product [Allacma fusca]|uniref:G-protein coupled receptors family 1 profile domain-containing protein n=1 Tax=Allacma fusca TaxID=39272 RepID=A0A8J2L4H5_9HEXA|nr:unnamed protein product [Allacma fusca]
MNTHNFVVEKLREILAKLEHPTSPTIPSSVSSTPKDSSLWSVSSIILRGTSTAPPSFSPATLGVDTWTKYDEVMETEEERDVSRERTLLDTVVNGSNNVVYGHASLFPSDRGDRTRETSSTIFGLEINTEPSSPSQRLSLHRKGTFFPVTDNSETTSLMKHLQELIHVLKMSSPSSKSNGPLLPAQGLDSTGFGGGKDMELNLTLDDITDLNNLMSDYGESSVPFKHIFIIISYLLIACISIIGNLLVVQLVIRSRRLHTLTHALLANLAVADLFMATLNIPFSAARVILAEWPFGSFLCQVVPFVQVTSVYVTSITMAVIAVDRYQVIINPLGRRMKNSQGVVLVIAIWSLSALLSLPFALHHKVVTMLTVRVVNRCQAEFSSMERRRWLTVATVLGQYLVPLIFTTVSYVSIMMRLGLRSSAMGSTTPRQVAAQSKAKRKTIKMLVLTVIFFAACWAPINAYHLLTHFSLVSHNSTAILTCHLIAMSSTCYNPFIYCWLNEHFRREALKWVRCFRSPQPSLISPGMDANGVLTRSEVLVRHVPTHQSSTLIQLLSYRSRPANHTNTMATPPQQPSPTLSSPLKPGGLGQFCRKSLSSSVSVQKSEQSSHKDALNKTKYMDRDQTLSLQSPSSEDRNNSAYSGQAAPSEVNCSLCQSSDSSGEEGCPNNRPPFAAQSQSTV